MDIRKHFQSNQHSRRLLVIKNHPQGTLCPLRCASKVSLAEKYPYNREPETDVCAPYIRFIFRAVWKGGLQASHTKYGSINKRRCWKGI